MITRVDKNERIRELNVRIWIHERKKQYNKEEREGKKNRMRERRE